MDSPLSTMKSRSSRIRNEKLGSEGGSFLRDWLWLTGLMHWSVRGSCFASCSNRRVPYRSLQNPTEAEGLCGLVRTGTYSTVLYTTEWERERQRIWWCLLATKINNNNITTTLPPPTEPSHHDKHNTSPSVSLSLLLSLSLLSLSLCHSHSLA